MSGINTSFILSQIFPDISYLSAVERKIIEDVLNRQKKEEEKEAQVLR